VSPHTIGDWLGVILGIEAVIAVTALLVGLIIMLVRGLRDG
jgi:hypothetical protein